jgi:Na+-transporting NADH:ubiquinone oxidoreductase subunit A
MSRVIRIKRGLNIPLKGEAEKVFSRVHQSDTFAVKPTDFPGLTPKLLVNEGDSVKAGSPLFCDKYRPEIVFTSPASGEVLSIVRGERRRILEVVIKSVECHEYIEFGKANPESLQRNEVVQRLLSSGVWPLIRQRPYAIIANPNDTPRDIFISGFDTSPLAPDLDFTVMGEKEAFQMGVDALSMLTEGNIYLSLNNDYPPNEVFAKATGVILNYFTGPHPAGNVGIQIHHIAPINKGEVVWTIDPLSVIILGRLFLNGIYDTTKVIALAGSEVAKPKYFITKAGASIKNLVHNNITQPNEKLRFISGNVLTGTRIEPQGHIGMYDNMVTVIPEGNHYEFFGWASPGFNKYSSTRSFFSKLIPDRKYALHTNLNGGERAFVLTGQYDRVLPMDIFPMHLLKAILAGDIEKMENLGIYEVAEEDFALCEYVCTSKTEVQRIIRDGIEMMIKELN